MSDSSGREIITLQVGRYSNFVGTHFWNFQDELLLLRSREGVVDAYDHSVLHRAATSERGTCTPRLVAFDTRDALGSMNPLGIVGGAAGESPATPETAQTSWAGGVSVFRQPELKKNALHAYLEAEEKGDDDDRKEGEEEDDLDGDDDLEDTRVTGHVTRLASHPFGLDHSVKTWPDFLKSRLHPRTLQELPFRDDSSEFGLYTAGSGEGAGVGDALGEGDREEHSDALRRQLEECDAPQGTQTFADVEGGWCGLSCALAAEIRQECRNRPRVCYAFLRRDGAETAPGCRVPGTASYVRGAGEGAGSRGGTAAASRSAVNLALGLHGLHEAFSLICVLDEKACAQTSPHVAADPRNAYHTSAIFGAAVDVATSPPRFSSMGLDEWASVGGGFGGGARAPAPDRSMVLASMSAWLPFPNPDASAESLRHMLDPAPAPERNAPLVATPAKRWAGTRDGLLSLGPSARLVPKVLLRGSRASAVSAGAIDDRVQVFSRKMVARGLTCPRADQLRVLGQVLGESGVGTGSSHGVSTSLPIPITYPLLFRASLGSRGEQLLSTSMGVGVGSGGGGSGGDYRGELRVMCDEISAITCVDRSSAMGNYVAQVVKGLDMRRGDVRLELEKNDLHRDDAVEVVESLTGLAESYGYNVDRGQLFGDFTSDDT